MNPLHVFFAHAGLVGFTLVVLAFLLFVPFYRTLTGWLLFGVKVNFWLILLLVVILYHDGESLVTTVLRDILYPATAVTGFALFGVILRAQITNRKIEVPPLRRVSAQRG